MDCISPLIGPLISSLWEQASYLVNAESNIDNMTTSMENLKACRDDLKKYIEDAKIEQKQSTKEVEWWLKKVDDIEGQADNTRKLYESRGRHLFGDCSLNCWSTYKFGKEAAMLFDEIVQLKTKRDGFRSVATGSTLLGQDQYVEMVRNDLKDNNVGVIGIYGMGGVGKTTLLKEIHKSLLGENNLGFKYLIHVVVSKEFQFDREKYAQTQRNLKHLADKGLLAAMAEKTIMMMSWGGPGGEGWAESVPPSTRLTNIKVRHGAAIDAIQYRYVVNGVATWSPQRGGDGGQMSEINLESGEYLKGIKGHYGKMWGCIVIMSLTFTSDRRRYGPYGQQAGTPFSLSKSDGKIVGFHGRSGALVDAIGVFVAPV